MYETSILPNGIAVVTECVPYARSVSIGFWLKVGSRMEGRDERGASHLIEHMLFKGTSSRTARQIAEEVDNIGGQLNAYTTKEYTCYYGKCPDTHTEVVMDVLCDMLSNPAMVEAEFTKEKGVVLEEIGMYEDTPDELAHDLIFQALWGDDPIGTNTLGTRETVEGLSLERLVDYMRLWYRPDNMVVTAVGNLDHRRIADAVDSRLGSLSGRRPQLTLLRPASLPAVIMKPRDTEQVHLCIGTEGSSRVDPMRYAISVVDGLLGGGMSSRLFQELREERGLVYSTYSYNSCYSDTGLFGVYAGMAVTNVEQVVELIRKQFSDIVSGKVSPQEVSRVKEQLKGSLMMNLESMSNRMSRLGKLVLFHRELTTPEEIIQKIDAVTCDDVGVAATRLLDIDHFAVSAVGSVDDSLGRTLLAMGGHYREI